MAISVALIIVDPQHDFGNSDGSLFVKNSEHVVPKINELRAALKAVGVKDVFITQDWHPDDHSSFAKNNPGTKPFDVKTMPDGTTQEMWPTHCVQGSRGAAFLDGLVVEDSDVIVQKGMIKMVDSYSGFGSNDGVSEKTPLFGLLNARGISHVVVCGLAFDYCVSYTARDAKWFGFQSCVVRSASQGIDTKSCVKEMARMKQAGVIQVDDIAGACAFATGQ
jgi:nicotinamidase/pyrazinamidase